MYWVLSLGLFFSAVDRYATACQRARQHPWCLVVGVPDVAERSASTAGVNGSFPRRGDAPHYATIASLAVLTGLVSSAISRKHSLPSNFRSFGAAPDVHHHHGGIYFASVDLKRQTSDIPIAPTENVKVARGLPSHHPL